MKNMKYVILSALLLFVLVPHSSQAYLTSGQEVIRLNESNVLYLIHFDFGSKKYDMRLPIAAYRKETPENSKALEYKIEDNRSESMYSKGAAAGIVLSKALIVDGHYFIPKGEGKRFTLAVILNVPEVATDEKLDLSLQVTKLPFTLKAENIEIGARLNDPELQYYVTPEAKFR